MTITKENQWYFSNDGKSRMGPVSKNKIEELLEQRTLSPNSLLWRPGLTNWVRLSDVPEVNQSESLLPPPLPKANTEPSQSVTDSCCYFRCPWCRSVMRSQKDPQGEETLECQTCGYKSKNNLEADGADSSSELQNPSEPDPDDLSGQMLSRNRIAPAGSEIPRDSNRKDQPVSTKGGWIRICIGWVLLGFTCMGFIGSLSIPREGFLRAPSPRNLAILLGEFTGFNLFAIVAFFLGFYAYKLHKLVAAKILYISVLVYLGVAFLSQL